VDSASEQFVEPFEIKIAADVLDDLAARLAASRPPVSPVLDGGESPEVIARIDRLLRYWRTGYDWRAQERRLNAYPHFRTTIDGVGIHFIHATGTGPNPLPLLLINGWPSSFVEYLGVLPALTAPATGLDSFDVVVATLPGFGFSDRCEGMDVSQPRVAQLLHRLMTERLGYGGYVAHGDDVGGGVVNHLGLSHTDAVLAIQTANWLNPAIEDPSDLTEDEQAYLAADNEWDSTEGAYAHIQRTRPQTLAYGLNDSPLGLAAWILEKFLTWSDPLTRDELSADDLLSTVMIYWCTQTIASSMRRYAIPYSPPAAGQHVLAPTSVLAPHEPKLPVPPLSWLRRGYADLRRYVRIEPGGHFLALESPTRFVDEIRTAFQPFRLPTSG